MAKGHLINLLSGEIAQELGRKPRLVTNNHVKRPRLLGLTPVFSEVVLQNLLACVTLFYAVYYVVLITGCIMLRVEELDVLAPFDFKTNPSWLDSNYKVLLVSTEVTYLVCGLLFVPVVEEWVWDYAISVTILHVAITSSVMLEFPLTSHWWAALGSSLISMICGGQILAYCLFKDNFIYPELDDF